MLRETLLKLGHRGTVGLAILYEEYATTESV
jgi:hypothetical protein